MRYTCTNIVTQLWISRVPQKTFDGQRDQSDQESHRHALMAVTYPYSHCHCAQSTCRTAAAADISFPCTLLLSSCQLASYSTMRYMAQVTFANQIGTVTATLQNVSILTTAFMLAMATSPEILCIAACVVLRFFYTAVAAFTL